MKILVPVDFSFESRQALAFAAAIGRLYHNHPDYAGGPELLIFHAFHPPFGSRANFFVDPERLRREENQVRNKMTRLQTTIPSLEKLRHRLILRMDSAKHGLDLLAAEEEADLVVMGIQSGEDRRYALMDSTTIHAIRHLQCPVLVVPSTTDVFYPKQVGLATDLESVRHPENLYWFKQLIRLWKAELNILHVHPAPATIDVDHASEALQMQAFFAELAPDYHFPEARKPIRGLQQYMRENPLDLLTLLHRRHAFPELLFHRSTSLGILQDLTIPLLILQD